MTDYVVPDTLAAPVDLAKYITGNPDATADQAPTNAVILLRSATPLVLSATETAYYDTDPDTGLATDDQVLNALRDATCIQAAAWDAIKYNPLAGGAITTLVAKSKKILSASFDVAGADAAAASQAAIASSLVPAAVRKLQQNGLLNDGIYSL